MSDLNRHDEFDQLLRGMRNRLVAVSEEVARTVTKANWHAETAPPHVRMRVQAGIADINSTQDWLHARLAQLPDDPQQRHAAMQEMLQVQFVAVQKVTTILDELLALRNKPVAPEYLPPEQRPYPAYGALDPGTPIARDFGPALISPATAPLFDQPAPLPSLFPLDGQARPSPQQPFPGHSGSYPAPGSGPMHPPQQSWDTHREPQWGPVPPGFGPQSQSPVLVNLADLEPSLAPPMAPGEMPRAFTARKTEQKPPPKGARKYQRSAPKSRVGLVTASLLAAIVAVGIGGHFVWNSVAGGTKPKRIAIGDPAARQGAGAVPGSAPVRSVDPIATRVPQAPPMSAPPFSEAGDDFVAVIATHREKDGLTNMFVDLRKQYPGIVGARKAIAQTMNLGADGVWYQLVLLPAGPRAQAESVCEELRQAGYPRCAVRPNKP